MASNPPGKCCTEGVLHIGESKGYFDKYADVDVYVTGDSKSERLLFVCPDIWSIKAANTRIMADNFANQGYVVVALDFFGGDTPSENAPVEELWAWFNDHKPETKIEMTRKVLEQAKLKFKEARWVGAIGYCYGGTPVVDLLAHGLVDVGALAHPSFVSAELVERIQKPVIISAAEQDEIFTAELRAKTEEILRRIKATYYMELFSGVPHGYAVRGDPKDKWVAACADKTFASQNWFFSLFQKNLND